MADRWQDESEGQHGTEQGQNAFISGLRSMETTHKPTLMLRCKVAVVGDACVGKSALIQLFHKNVYPKNYIMTTWVDFCVKQVNIPDTNAAVELYLFDCAGQKVFSTTDANSAYFENTSMVMAVYDVTNKGSFDSLRMWLSKVRSRRPPNAPALPGVLVANKIDLRGEDGGLTSRSVVTQQQGIALAEAEGLEYFETSAAQQVQHEAPFHFMADRFHKKFQETVRRAEVAAQGSIVD